MTIKPVFRRRRKHTGDDIENGLHQGIQKLDAVRRDRGLLCRACGKVIFWRKLKVWWEFDNKEIVRLWSCDRCGNVLRSEVVLSREESS